MRFEPMPRNRKHVSNGLRPGPGAKPKVDWSKAEHLWRTASLAEIGRVCGCTRQAAYYQRLRRQRTPEMRSDFARHQARALFRLYRAGKPAVGE